jgi:hypothetical protein
MKKLAGVYLLGGVTLVSEISLPELPLLQPDEATPHPVTIRVGPVADSLVHSVEIDPDCFATAHEYFVRIDGIARYLVSHGREVVVDIEPGALALNVRAYLLGTIFAVLCQQRGLVPLHASAVSRGGGVLAFLGRSGQGKSSLVAHLAQRGFAVMADDICLIDFSEELMVVPTAPWLKLWRNSLESVGKPVAGLERVFSEDDKYRLPVERVVERQPLRTLMFLDEIPSSAVKIEAVSAVEAVPLLMNLIHQAYLLEATGQRAESFLRCSRISSGAKAYRLSRPWGLEYLGETLDAVEEFL